MHAPANSTARPAGKSAGLKIAASALWPEFHRLSGNLSRHSLDAAGDISKRLWDRRLACRWGVVSQANWTGETPVPLRSGTFAAVSAGIAETSRRPKNNPRKGCDNFLKVPANFLKGSGNFLKVPANCRKVSANFPDGRGNFLKGCANFPEACGNFPEGPDNCPGVSANCRRVRGNFLKGSANFLNRSAN